MSNRLSGKVSIITGTGGSMGREAALTFAREGASVVGCDVNVAAAEATVEMVRAQGGTMISLQPCHLTEPSECQALVDLAVREYGRIDVLFNNAAMAYFNWLEDITNEEWNVRRHSSLRHSPLTGVKRLQVSHDCFGIGAYHVKPRHRGAKRLAASRD